MKKGRGSRLPSPAKSETGYIPSCGFTSVSRTDSDMEISSSGSEDEINGGGSYFHMKDGKYAERLKRNSDSKQLKRFGSVDDEQSDSTISVEVSFGYLGIKNSGLFQRATTQTSETKKVSETKIVEFCRR